MSSTYQIYLISKVISNIKNVFGENYVYNEEYLKEKKDDINNILNKQPEKHTFIFYKLGNHSHFFLLTTKLNYEKKNFYTCIIYLLFNTYSKQEARN